MKTARITHFNMCWKLHRDGRRIRSRIIRQWRAAGTGRWSESGAVGAAAAICKAVRRLRLPAFLACCLFARHPSESWDPAFALWFDAEKLDSSLRWNDEPKGRQNACR
ncbi:MAG TPA: hypothetical protein VJ724_12800 [Tahibacter sp.]|nr:hypothetical protein [Tahibacter sp.]